MPNLGSPDPKAEQASINPDDPARTTLAFNPIMGMRTNDLTDAAQVMLKAVATQPMVAAKAWMGLMGNLVDIVTGKTDTAPDKSDKRFADPTWGKSKIHKGLWQGYNAWSHAVNEFVEKAELSTVDRQRAQLISSIVIDAMAPSNSMLTNPASLRQAIDTGGASLVSGAKNFIGDLINNGGMPSSVDKSKFTVGKNIATSPGACVFRNEVIELIQYAPQTEQVQAKPVIIVPPQINKYYSVDLAPDKSMIQYLTRNGLQVFCISWRNPTPNERHWKMETYIEALDEAVDATLKITGAKDATMMGSCSGGITLSTYAGFLAAKNEHKINGMVLAVCVLDTATSGESQFTALVTPETIRAAREVTRIKGVLDGSELASVFAWMRPNDLIWNYWVNNYLLGNPPPAYDVLYWNSDTTRLPAGLHHDFLDIIHTNPFKEAGAMKISGKPIDMKKVKLDTYVIGGTTDHITPWKAVYQTARIFGDKTTFVLSNSGHLQSLLNPPGNPKAFFVTGPATENNADAWAQKSQRNSGSWWVHWVNWLEKRSGEKVTAPKDLGSKAFPILAPAPGTYVFEP